MVNKAHSRFEDKTFAEFFARLRSSFATRVAREIVRLASVSNGQSLLDIGCGPGLMAKSIMSQRKLSRAVLVDRSQEMVKRARSNLSELSNNYAIKKSDLEKDDLGKVFNLKRGKFDHIIAVDL